MTTYTMRSKRQTVSRYALLLAMLLALTLACVWAIDAFWGDRLSWLTGLAVGLVVAPALADARGYLWRVASRPGRSAR